MGGGYVRGCNLPFVHEIATFGIGTGAGHDSDSAPGAAARCREGQVAACTLGDCGLRAQGFLRRSRRVRRKRRGLCSGQTCADVSALCLRTAEDEERGNSSCGEHMGLEARHSPRGNMGVSESEMRWNGTDKNWPSQIIEFVHPLTSTPNNSTPRTVTLHCPRHQQS